MSLPAGVRTLAGRVLVSGGGGGAGSDPHVRVALRAVVADHRVDGRPVAAAAGRRVAGNDTVPLSTRSAAGAGRRVAELFGIAFAAQPVVDAATPAHQDLLERRAEVAVEPRVDDRVERKLPTRQRAAPARGRSLMSVGA